MRLGLIRHFPVTEGMPTGWNTAAQLSAWRRAYELAAAQPGPADLGGIAWAHCLSSDLPRAYLTAKTVFSGPITQTDLLREAQFAEFRTGNLRLPVWGWRLLLQFTWMTGHRSQRAERDEFRRRVRALAGQLEAGPQDTLVVSHAGMMMYLSAELRRRGFSGPKFRWAQHAQVYVFQKASAAVPGAKTNSPDNLRAPMSMRDEQTKSLDICEAAKPKS